MTYLLVKVKINFTMDLVEDLMHTYRRMCV